MSAAEPHPSAAGSAPGSEPLPHEDPTPPDARSVPARPERSATTPPGGLPPAVAALAAAEDRVAALNSGGSELSDRLEIEFLEARAQRVTARMPVVGNRQPARLLHGGATIALAETVASIGAFLHGATLGRLAVGLEVSASHHASAQDGWVVAVAEPLRLGRSVATYEVVVRAEADHRRISTVRVTCFLKDL